MSVLSTWPVFVQDWQFECCGEPFAIGDEVAWTLVFVSEPPITTPEEMFVDCVVKAESTGTADDGRSGQIVRVGDELCAWLQGDDRLAVEAMTRGMLIEEHHGGVPADIARTRGIVRRIRLVTQDYRNVGGVQWEPASARADYMDLPATPAGFRSDLEAAPLGRVQTGLLVDFEVSDREGRVSPLLAGAGPDARR